MDLLLILVIVLIVVLVWRGPQMLPQFGEALGKTVKGVRDNIADRSGDAVDDKAMPTTDDSSAPAAKTDDDGKPDA